MYVMRPKGLTAICIIGFILAGLGFFALSGGLIWGIFGEELTEGMLKLMPLPPAQLQQQMDLQQPLYDEIGAIQTRWLPVTITLTILHLVLIALLFVGGARALKMRPKAGKLLAAAMLFAILFELGRVYPNLLLQEESMEVSMRHNERVMQTSGNPAQTRAMINFTRRIQEVSMALAYLIAGGWLLAKVGFYGTSLWYLNRKSVKALFEPHDSSAG